MVSEKQYMYIASTKKLDALLAAQGNKPIATTRKIIGLHFQFAHEDGFNACDDRVVAIAIGHDLPTACAVVLQVNLLDKTKLIFGLKTLLEDSATIKILFDVERVARWLQNFGMVDDKLFSCMDLQLMYQLLVDPKASQTNFTDIVLELGGKSSFALEQQLAEFNAKLKPFAWTKSPLAPTMLTNLVETMRLYTRCYIGACGHSEATSKLSPIYAMTSLKWSNAMLNRSTSTSTSSVLSSPIFRVEKERQAIVQPLHSTPIVNALRQETLLSVASTIKHITSDSELLHLLRTNNMRLVSSFSSVVGIHFQFAQANTSGQYDDDKLAIVSIAGANPLDTAVVLQLNTLDQAQVFPALKALLDDLTTVKVMYNIQRAAFCLSRDGLNLKVNNCIDLQVAYEENVSTTELYASMLQIVDLCNSMETKTSSLAHSTQSFKARLWPTNSAEWAHKLLPESLLQIVANNAQLYAQCYSTFNRMVTNAMCCLMTKARWYYAIQNQGHHAIWFDPDAGNQPRSIEYFVSNNLRMITAPPLPPNIPPLEIQCELKPLLDLLPRQYQDAILAINSYHDKLVDICLDVGRIPIVYTGKRQRVVLSQSGKTITKEIIDEIVDKLGGEARIGGDNRAGIDRQLHRISVMRSKSDEIYGLTMRVGRALRNAACVLMDLLLSDKHVNKSVLILGHPGSGKTTLIRDVARCVSETMENVCIIDTSNEIGGDGLVPHECVGWARRMMVPSLEAQAGVMIECVQNHTVETLIVDEIGRKTEVVAASTVRQRGPRIIASAHGDFRALLKNPDLKGLVGGSQQVIVGDKEAKSSSQGKLQTQRAGTPIFDVIVELDHVVRGRCHIIWDVAKAVDKVLEGRNYAFETRRYYLLPTSTLDSLETRTLQ